MSFKVAPTGGGKPLIFWEQQAIEKKKGNKKFPYKGREQKFGVRGKQGQEDVAPGTAAHQRRPGATTRQTNRAQQPTKKAVPNGKTAGNKKSAADANTVTLTQTQLNSILETIGNLTVTNTELIAGKEQLAVPPAGPKIVVHSKSPVSDASEPPLEPVPVSPDVSIDATSGEAVSPRVVVATPSAIPGLEEFGERRKREQHQQQSPRQPQPPPPREQPRIPKAHMSKAEQKRQQWENERGEYGDTAAPPWMQNKTQHQGAPTQEVSPTVVKAHMTHAERKRLQWDQEREENAKRNAGQIRVNGVAKTNGHPPPPPTVSAKNVLPDHSAATYQTQSKPLTKAEQKRRQWEAEQGEYGNHGNTLPSSHLSDADHHHQVAPPMHDLSPGTDAGSQLRTKPYLTKGEQRRQKWELERQASEDNKDIGLLIKNDKRQKIVNNVEDEFSVAKLGLTKAEKRRLAMQRDSQVKDVHSGLVWNRPETPRARRGKKDPRMESRLGQNTPAVEPMSPRSVPRAHLTRAEQRRLQEEQEEGQTGLVWQREGTLETFRGKGKGVTPGGATKSPETLSMNTHKGNLSLAERKRMKWEEEKREKEEIERAWREYQRQQAQDIQTQKLKQLGLSPGANVKDPSRQANKSPPEEYVASKYSAIESQQPQPIYVEKKANIETTEPSLPTPGPEIIEYEVISENGTCRKRTLQRDAKKNLTQHNKNTNNANYLTSATQAVQAPEGGSVAPPGPVRAAMTKAEIKRQQWEKERAETAGQYDPWGRPGAGAPVRDQQGNILADFNSRKEQLAKQVVVHANPQHAPPPVEQATPPVPAWAANQPAAMRSSMAIGGVGDNQAFMTTKELQKKQWLEELERQKEEKRLQKAQEKIAADKVDTWADRFSVYHPSDLPKQVTTHTVADDTAVTMAAATKDANVRTSSAPVPGQAEQGATYLRGQNVPLDAATQRDMELKRKRYEEHQQAIRHQVDEKQRLKREEREKRIQEELEEERKLAAERDRMQQQFVMEQQKAREKEEAQKRRTEMMKEAMDNAAADAAREKHEQRMRKLQRAGHDTTHLKASFEAPSSKMSPRPGLPPGGMPAQPGPYSSRYTPLAPSGGDIVEPSYIPGLHPTPREADVAHGTPYIESGTLTPRPYRQAEQTPRREFGVQTERRPEVEREESVQIEYKGPFADPKSKKGTKKVRVQSAEEAPPKKKGPAKINERPRWGAPKGNQKKVVKQSERDPNYQKRKDALEARKIARQRQLQEMAEQNAPRAANIRSRSKSRDNQVNPKSDPNRKPGTRRSEVRARSGSSPVVSNRVKQRSPSPPIPTVQRQNRPPSPPLPTHQTRHQDSRGQGQNNPRSRLDTHRSKGVPSHRSVVNAQEEYRTDSPPVPALWKQQAPQEESAFIKSDFRSDSPPIPAIKHRLENDYNFAAHEYKDTSKNNNNPQNDSSRIQSRYTDSQPVVAPVNDGEFIPFVRSFNTLDPAKAEMELPLSREATAVQKARDAYVHGHQPGNYGAHLENYADKPTHVPNQLILQPIASKDPILNPSLVTNHPTERQDRILQQLSDLRKGLKLKQRELEVAMPTMMDSD